MNPNALLVVTAYSIASASAATAAPPMRAAKQSRIVRTFDRNDLVLLRRSADDGATANLKRVDNALRKSGYKPQSGPEHALAGTGKITDGHRRCSFTVHMQDYQGANGHIKLLTHTDAICANNRFVRTVVLSRQTDVMSPSPAGGDSLSQMQLFVIDDAYKDPSDEGDGYGGGGDSWLETIYDAPWCNEQSDADCLKTRPPPDRSPSPPESGPAPPGSGDVLKCFVDALIKCFF